LNATINVVIYYVSRFRPEYDGNYCATAYWTPKTGYRFEPWGQVKDIAAVPNSAARACFKDSTLENGWSKMEIDTQAGYPDRVQAFAAGMLEGVLTWKSIYDHWYK
jgi:Phospholipase B